MYPTMLLYVFSDNRFRIVMSDKDLSFFCPIFLSDSSGNKDFLTFEEVTKVCSKTTGLTWKTIQAPELESEEGL